MMKRIVVISSLFLLTACAGRELPSPSPPQTAAPPPLAISDSEGSFKAAMNAFNAGDAEKTVRLAQQAVQKDLNSPWRKRSLFLMMRAYILSDNDSMADAAMLRVQDEYPELADYAVYLLAEYYYSKSRLSRAAALFERLAEMRPDSNLAVAAAFKRAQALLESGLFFEAAEAFGKFLEENPKSELAPEAGLGLGRSLAEQTRLKESLRAYLDVYVKYPGNSYDERVEKAFADLSGRGADMLRPTPDEWHARGKNLFRTGQYEKANKAFEKALESDPKHPQKAAILLRSGVSLYNLGRRIEAAATLERMLKECPGDPQSAEALNWLGKSYSRLGEGGKAVNAYMKIVSNYPESEWADDALYLVGNVYRESSDAQKALRFYGQLAAVYPESTFADSALWWKAWTAYISEDYIGAVKTLQELLNRYPKSFLASQARYWQGRAAEKSSDINKAVGYYKKALAKGQYTYYGHRAAERLSRLDLPAYAVNVDDQPDEAGAVEVDKNNEMPQQPAETYGPPAWNEDAVKALSSDLAFRKALELMRLSMNREAAAELWALQEAAPKKHGALLGLSKAFFELGDYHRSLILILRSYERSLESPAWEAPADLWLLAYPRAYWDSIVSYSRKYDQDPFFISAIMREESQFHTEAVSPAGARGVMQVMPTTGEWIAKTVGIYGFERGKLFDPDTSINIGTWYVGQLMKRFKGDPLLVAAAYNAGPEPVSTWISRNGSGVEKDEFVETIPYAETRGYVKKVMRNYYEYRRIYSRAEER